MHTGSALMQSPTHAKSIDRERTVAERSGSLSCASLDGCSSTPVPLMFRAVQKHGNAVPQVMMLRRMSRQQHAITVFVCVAGE